MKLRLEIWDWKTQGVNGKIPMWYNRLLNDFAIIEYQVFLKDYYLTSYVAKYSLETWDSK